MHPYGHTYTQTHKKTWTGKRINRDMHPHECKHMHTKRDSFSAYGSYILYVWRRGSSDFMICVH